MKMKHLFGAGLLGVLLACGLSSCGDDKNEYYVPYSYAVGDMVVAEGHDPYIQLDDKTTLFPSNGTRLPGYLTKDRKSVV